MRKPSYLKLLVTFELCIVAVGIYMMFNLVKAEASKTVTPYITGESIPVGIDMSEYNAGLGNILNTSITVEELQNATYEMDKLNKELIDKAYGEPWIIRCTGYCDYGYTKSGEYVRNGVIAGKQEWLGKIALLYEVNEDNTVGELIGEYEFLDTGYGINGSLIDGTSVDVWHPSEDAVWDWMAEYGDYVYIQIIEKI